MRILLSIAFLFGLNSVLGQWRFIRENDSIQPRVFGLKVMNNKIVFYGSTLSSDQTGHGFVGLQISALDFSGNLIADTIHGNSNQSFIPEWNSPGLNSKSVISQFVLERNQALFGNYAIGRYGILIDSTLNYSLLHAFVDYPYAMSMQHVQLIDSNRIFSSAQSTNSSNDFTEILFLRIIDSTGILLKELQLTVPNRRLFCHSMHEHEDYYYFHITQIQNHPSSDFLPATIMTYKVHKESMEIINSTSVPGMKYTGMASVVTFENGDFVRPVEKVLSVLPDGSNRIATKALRKYDKNLNLIWEKEFGYTGLFAFIRSIQKDKDGNIVVICNDDYDGLHGMTSLFKFDPDGNIIFKRNFIAVYSLNSWGTTTYPMCFDFMPDGGYVMGGYCTIMWPQRDVGWVMRTNCLGFMGPPQAALSHAYGEDYKLTFTNNSTEASSYTWIFDDGTLVETPENSAPLEHTFANLEIEHTVTLIAHGCEGENDTLVYTIPVHPDFVIEPPVVNPPVPDVGFFALYPNPNKPNSPINLVVNKQNEVHELVLKFYSNSGILVESFKIPNQDAVVMLPIQLSQGLYHVSLFGDERLLATKKLVIGE